MSERVTPKRSLRPVAMAFTGIAVLLLIVSGRWSGVTVPAVLVPIGVVMIAVDHWTASVAPSVDWSFGEAVAVTALVLTAPGQAPFTAMILGVAIAFSDVERRRFELDRFLTNIGQFAITGFAAGVVFEAVRVSSSGPSLALAGAIAVTVMAWILTNTVLVSSASWYRYGRYAIRVLVRRILPLVWRAGLLAVALGIVASTIDVLGTPWIVVVLALTVTLAALPIIKMRTEAHRADLLATVTGTLNARGVVHDIGGRLERLAVDAAQRLSFSAKQIEQLRYVTLLYLTTDSFAGARPRSLDDQFRDQSGTTAPTSALLFGLPLADIADPPVIRLADAAAEFDALTHPPEGGAGLTRRDAFRELERSGVKPDIVRALGSLRPVSDAYLRAWRLHPEFVWRTSLRSLLRRA